MAAVLDAANRGAALEPGRFQPSVLDVNGIHEKVEKSLVKKVQKLVGDYPGQALQVVRGWMAEGV